MPIAESAISTAVRITKWTSASVSISPSPALRLIMAPVSADAGVRKGTLRHKYRTGKNAFGEGGALSIETPTLRSELVLDSDIRSGNYTIDTENGSVYLIGSARSHGCPKPRTPKPNTRL